VTKGLIRLAVIPDGYPDKKLVPEKIAQIRKTIRGRILSEKATAPTFTGSWERDGALTFACANEATRDWLDQARSRITRSGTLPCVWCHSMNSLGDIGWSST